MGIDGTSSLVFAHVDQFDIAIVIFSPSQANFLGGNIFVKKTCVTIGHIEQN